MKKIILFLFLSMAVSLAQAQFGIMGGINIANWGGDDVDDMGETKSSLVGPHFGAFYNLKFGASMFSVQPELVFSRQGVQFENAGFEIKYATSYLNFTPLFRWNSNSGFFLGTAPQIGYLLSAEAKANDQEEDIKDDLEDYDFSWAFAAGYEFKGGLGFYGRFNLGLSSIDNDEVDPVDIKNRVFQVGVRYTFMPK